jgi:hypothetical protein
VFQLRRHVKLVHEKKLAIHCHVCGMGMRDRRSLKMHSMRKHKDDPGTKKMIEKEKCCGSAKWLDFGAFSQKKVGWRST